MLKKLLFVLVLIYARILNSSAIITDVDGELDRNETRSLEILYRAPKINLGNTIGHLFLEMTVTQQHYHSKFAVVNPDEIGAFFQNCHISNSIISSFAELNLNPLYYEYVFVGESVSQDIFTHNGWQIRYGYAAVINDMPLTIKISPKASYMETVRHSKTLAQTQRNVLKNAFAQLIQSVRTISAAEKREQAKEFLSHVKTLTKKALHELKEMSVNWKD